MIDYYSIKLSRSLSFGDYCYDDVIWVNTALQGIRMSGNVTISQLLREIDDSMLHRLLFTAEAWHSFPFKDAVTEIASDYFGISVMCTKGWSECYSKSGVFARLIAKISIVTGLSVERVMRALYYSDFEKLLSDERTDWPILPGNVLFDEVMKSLDFVSANTECKQMNLF